MGTKRQLLFIISADPRLSGKASEAIRIAAGLAAWKQIDITVFLHGEAQRLLGRDEALRDSEILERHLPLLAEHAAVFTGPPQLESSEPPADAPGEPPLIPSRQIDLPALARLAAAADSVLHF